MENGPSKEQVASLPSLPCPCPGGAHCPGTQWGASLPPPPLREQGTGPAVLAWRRGFQKPSAITPAAAAASEQE